MGQSTDAIICFGISFPEEYQFPWEKEKHEHWHETWWRSVNGFDGSKAADIWTPAGNLRPGVTDDDAERHFRERNAWDEANPMPVKIVQHCSGDYPMYIIAAMGTEIVARRGFPEEVPDLVGNAMESDRKVIIDFCEKYLRPEDEYDEFPEMNPKWWLASNWL